MTLNELECISDALYGIREVLDGNRESFKMEVGVPASFVIGKVEKWGVEIDKDMEVVGTTYWMTWRYQGKLYTFGGSGYHGGLEFGPKEDPDVGKRTEGDLASE